MKKPLSQKIVVATSCMYVNLHCCKLLSVQLYLAPLNSVASPLAGGSTKVQTWNPLAGGSTQVHTELPVCICKRVINHQTISVGQRTGIAT